MFPGHGTTKAGGVRPADPQEAGTWLELSAPIWPKVLVLYQQEAERYPAEPDQQVALARDAAITFEQLLAVCAERYAGVTVSAGDGSELTPGQLRTNYRIVAQCAYEQFTAKPYWIPQLVLDVDICAEALGEGWRTPEEDDVARFTATDLAFIERSVNGIGSAPGAAEAGATTPSWSWESAGMYFSLFTWVRMANGSVGGVDLDPGADHVPVAVSYPAGKVVTLPMQSHYEAGWALRCLRTGATDDALAAAG